jgi:hypothetical protein
MLQKILLRRELLGRYIWGRIASLKSGCKTSGPSSVEYGHLHTEFLEHPGKGHLLKYIKIQCNWIVDGYIELQPW